MTMVFLMTCHLSIPGYKINRIDIRYISSLTEVAILDNGCGMVDV